MQRPGRGQDDAGPSGPPRGRVARAIPFLGPGWPPVVRLAGSRSLRPGSCAAMSALWTVPPSRPGHARTTKKTTGGEGSRCAGKPMRPRGLTLLPDGREAGVAVPLEGSWGPLILFHTRFQRPSRGFMGRAKRAQGRCGSLAWRRGTGDRTWTPTAGSLLIERSGAWRGGRRGSICRVQKIHVRSRGRDAARSHRGRGRRARMQRRSADAAHRGQAIRSDGRATILYSLPPRARRCPDRIPAKLPRVSTTSFSRAHAPSGQRASQSGSREP